MQTSYRNTVNAIQLSFRYSNKISIFGIGAIGGIIASEIAESSENILYLVSKTKFDKLTVRFEDKTSIVNQKQSIFNCFDNKQIFEPSDWIFVSTKTQQTKQIFDTVKKFQKENYSKVAIFQNGIDQIERMYILFKENNMKINKENIVQVIVNLPSEKLNPGNIEQTSFGTLQIQNSSIGNELKNLFPKKSNRMTIELSANMKQVMWRKLMVNAAIGGICALLKKENGVLKEDSLYKIVLQMMNEIINVANAEGANLEENLSKIELDNVLEWCPTHQSSITLDRIMKRKTEWKTRNEIIQTLSKKHKICTPINDTVIALLKASEVKS